MPDTLSKALLSRLLRSDVLRAHLRAFHLLSGMDALFLDPLGNPLLAWPRQSALPLLALMRATPEGRRKRDRVRQVLLAGLEFGENASAGDGLVEIAHRMQIDGRTVGYWLLSAGRDPAAGLRTIERGWKEEAKAGGAAAWAQWKGAWEQLPACTREQAVAWRSWQAMAAAEVLRHLEMVGAPDPGTQALPAAVRQACAWVREHHAETIRLDEVAARCGISTEYLSRLFHQSTGLRFREFLAETRLNHACAQLAGTRDRIADIAAASGFPTLSRFNQAFREHTGLTPRQWRESRR